MINIINYLDIVNLAMLALLNNPEVPTFTQNNFECIDLRNRKVVKSLQFYLEDLLTDKLVFGAKNIIINTCEPKDNRKNIDNSLNLSSKYFKEDDSIYFDIVYLQHICEGVFKKYRKNNYNLIMLGHSNLDTFDLMYILETNFVISSFPNQLSYLISDNNLKLFENKREIEPFFLKEVSLSLL